jgi:hypothetical protein
MKKKIKIVVIVVLALIAILYVPIPMGTLNDGGTRVYCSLTYKIVAWHRETDDGLYENTQVYWGDDRFHDTGFLWNIMESRNVPHQFRGKILKMQEDWVTVEPLKGEEECHVSLEIRFHTAELPRIQVDVGDVMEIHYIGNVGESRIHATDWKLVE